MIQLNTNEINGVSLLKDVQNKLDDRGIAIQKVGINDVFLPFLIRSTYTVAIKVDIASYPPYK